MTITRCSIIGLFLLFAAFNNAAQAADNKYVPSARKADIKYIKCEVCELLVKQILRQHKEKEEKKAPKKLTEMEVIEMTERVCDIKYEEGDWIQWLDIQEQGTKLKVVQQSEVGECLTKCKTIQKTCQELMGDSDTDIAELLYSGQANRAALSKLLCRQLSRACTTKTPPVPADREAGEAFTPKSADEVERERLTRNMNAMPMPGGQKMKVYSREELMEKTMKGMKGPGEGGDDDDDDEDEEEDVPIRKPKDGTPPPPQPRSPIRSDPASVDVGERVKRQEGGEKIAKGGGESVAKDSDAWVEYARKHATNAAEKGQIVALEAHKTGREVISRVQKGISYAWDWVKDKSNGVGKGGRSGASTEL